MELIDLQHSHVTQHITKNNDKTSWRVCQNNTSIRLAELPKHLTEAEVFDIMAFAKKYELIAFNIGIALGKKKNITIFNEETEKLKKRLNLAIIENERLAIALDKLTRKEV